MVTRQQNRQEHKTNPCTNKESSSLYDTLNISSTASQNDIRKAYLQLCLIYHPDKTKEKDSNKATKIFQNISKAYKILSNLHQRQIYDETGLIHENECDMSDLHDMHQWTEEEKQNHFHWTMDQLRSFEKDFIGKKLNEKPFKFVIYFCIQLIK